MNQYISSAAKVFLHTYLTLLLPVAAMLALLFLGGKDAHLMNSVLEFGLMSTAICALVLTIFQVASIKPEPGVLPAAGFGVRQTLVASATQAPAQIIDRLQKGLLPHPWKIVNVDRETGTLRFETGSTWRSLGEVIEIRARPQENGGTELRAVSMPFIRFAPIDFGKNRQNIQLLRRILET
ncbi:MAG: hypothetical protein H6575_19335 [Lewinellaceae bacterium]|nr:hypothetical protein [Saprospiraceae bacterium]MCB9356723.1 hypothetical protein [Lewinellaceae bacterium]